jgi:hypothetical protein
MVTAQLAVDPWRVAVTEADSIFVLFEMVERTDAI